ncbi:DNA circularization protein [Azospirillum tabaci]|uniref:DNA circularization protein n=1 Tax=Azospirillum tabaci TaxID=2752310 RepID=UPI0016617824|nr:DNA circularization N-terminal domain-containing protein [Azospirillum tabaci]
MAWRDQLRPASFRGVPFKVDSDDLTAGRRVQLHEYPQRDKPYAEDLGRATRKITLTAYVIGPDYMAQRGRLLAALEEAGSGELVHPQYGTLQVVADGECRVAHSRDEGGLCRFSLSFVEAGELTFPSATVNTAETSRLKADALSSAAIGDFASAFGIEGVPDFVDQAAVADFTSALGFAERAMRSGGGGWRQLASGLLGDLTELFGVPMSLGGRVMNLFAAFGGGGGGGGGSTLGVASPAGAVGSPASRLGELSQVAGYSPPPPSYAVSTPARRQQAANSEATASLFRRGALVQSARTAADAEWPVYDDAIQTRDRLAAQIDAEAMRPGVSDDTFRALTDLRVAVVQDITSRSAGSARLSTVTPSTVQPSLVLAYDLYEDAGRGDEIVARNGIAHPGFVPPEPLKVLA